MGRERMSITMLSILLFVAFLILYEFDVISNSKKIPDIGDLEEKRQMPKDPITSLPWQISRAGIITCDPSRYEYDICSINGPNVLSPNISTFFAMDPTNSIQSTPSIEKIKPQPRKTLPHIMSKVNELTLISGGPKGPKCEVQHNFPALVFSTGEFTGNFWHDMADGLIPLFFTAKSFFHDQDFVMVIDQSYDYWINKYRDLLHGLSKQRIIRMDQETRTHCFPRAIVGLIRHGYMTINPNWLPNPMTLHHFHDFLVKTYGHGGRNQHTVSHQPRARRRPRAVFIRRHHGRVLYNYAEVKRAMEETGFEVIEFEPTMETSMHESYAIFSSCHALIGVHGAGLTHLLFLRPGTLLLQIVLIGQDNPAKNCYKTPALEIGLEYIKYKISIYESSYMEKYGKDSVVFKNPKSFLKGDSIKEYYDLYIKNQDVTLNLTRFRPYLEETYEKAKDLMDRLP
ncbi:Glycosyltransferase 61 [Dillenia turbinata]|uniref:Glycosyltransferase 61 n=1 Tax=Dillenia turbinata TaxID=194707 RepID=A0AAN8VKC5_9MAGN